MPSPWKETDPSALRQHHEQKPTAGSGGPQTARVQRSLFCGHTKSCLEPVPCRRASGLTLMPLGRWINLITSFTGKGREKKCKNSLGK